MAETTLLRVKAINKTPTKPAAQLSGQLPVVQVNMNSGGPSVQGGQNTARQGVTILPPKGRTTNIATGGIKDPLTGPTAVVEVAEASAPAAALTADQLLFCRHLVDKHLQEQRTLAEATPAADVEGAAPVAADAMLAQETLTSIDNTMLALTAAAAAASAPSPPSVPRPVGQRSGPASTQRRVTRGAAPMVSVRMDAGRPVPDVPTQPNRTMAVNRPAPQAYATQGASIDVASTVIDAESGPETPSPSA